MKIVTAGEMREIDRVTTQRFGVPSLTLMENAGTAVADFVVSEYPSAARIGVICGKGNNGGDGFVAARKLKAAGREVRIVLLAEPSELRGDAAEMFAKLPVAPVIVRSGEELKQESARVVFESEVLLDAILGTGFRPPVSELYGGSHPAAEREFCAGGCGRHSFWCRCRRLGRTGGHGCARRWCGYFHSSASRPRLWKIDRWTDSHCSDRLAGRSDRFFVATQSDYCPRDRAPRSARVRSTSNKGNFGHVLVIGGSVGKAGSVAMAGMAALRSGAGLSTVATPKSVLATVAGFHPEVMTEPLDETNAGTISTRAGERLDALSKGMTVLAVGPGISRNQETSEFVRSLVVKTKTPMVLDADGLNAFEGRAGELNGKGRTLVITPASGRDGSSHWIDRRRCATRSNQRCSHLRPRTRIDRGA